MKKIIVLTVTLACIGAGAYVSAYADLEIKNEKDNAKIVEIGKSYAKGKITPEQVREKIAKWRSSRTDVRNVDDNKRMRDVPRGKQQESSEHIRCDSDITYSAVSMGCPTAATTEEIFLRSTVRLKSIYMGPRSIRKIHGFYVRLRKLFNAVEAMTIM